MREHKADLGIAWDGDFDRCFFYDNEGNFIEGYYLVGLLASELLPRFPGARIIYDTRVYWNTRELIQAGGGIPVMGKTGHAFMKERMRAEDAVYGGEMSAHHYFRDFAYCDSGMLPWMLVIAAMQRHGKPLAELVRERMDAWPCSGEINRRVADAPALMRKIRDHYAPAATYEDAIDGVNLEFGNWRFNLRMSNTEPLLRLNVESRADRACWKKRPPSCWPSSTPACDLGWAREGGALFEKRSPSSPRAPLLLPKTFTLVTGRTEKKRRGAHGCRSPGDTQEGFPMSAAAIAAMPVSR